MSGEIASNKYSVSSGGTVIINDPSSEARTPTAPPPEENRTPPPSPPPPIPPRGAENQPIYPCLPSTCRSTSVKYNREFSFVEIEELSLPVHDSYARRVCRVGRISYSTRKVMGMVLLDNVLYVLHKQSNVLSAYDTKDTNSRCFIVPPVRNLHISGLVYPRGLDANRSSRYLFMTDKRRLSGSGSGALMKVSLDGAVVCQADIPYEPFGVSFSAPNERIIVACCKNTNPFTVPMFGAGYIMIFEDVSGGFRQVQLISLGENVEIPRHVIQAPEALHPGRGKEYLVVYGWTQIPGIECHHRVSRINNDGRILMSFGIGHGDREDQVDRPMSICLDDGDKMFVVDSFNDRVLLMTRTPSANHDLALVRPIVTSANGLRRPRHVCLDAAKRMLFVGDDYGHIDVFDVGGSSGGKISQFQTDTWQNH